jgi:hypothetical protein
MGTISANKLGGISLIVGPLVAVALWLLLFAILNPLDGSSANFAGVAAQAAATGDLQNILLLLPALFLVMWLYGLTALQGSLEDSGHGPVVGMGMVMVRVWIVAVVIGSGLQLSAAWQGSAGANVVAATSSLSLYAGLVGGLGLLLVSLAVAATRKGLQSILSYIVALALVVTLVFSVVGILDTSQWNVVQPITAVSYVLVTLWSIMLGRDMLNA